jgi:hypothetical protein
MAMTFSKAVRQLELKLDAAQTPEKNPEAIAAVIKEIAAFAKTAKPTTQNQRDAVDRLIELGKLAELGQMGD